MTMQDLRPGLDLSRRPFVRYMAIIDDINALGQRQRRRKILLHQNDRLAGIGQIGACFHQIPNDDRSKSFERLIQQDDLDRG